MSRVPVPPVKRVTVDDLCPIRPPAAPEPEAEATWDIVIRDTLALRDGARVRGFSAKPLDRLVAKMRDRDRKGLAEYGRRLAPNNGRNSLGDAQEELLDALAYLECAIYEASSACDGGTTLALREIQAQCLDGAVRIETILGGDAS